MFHIWINFSCNCICMMCVSASMSVVLQLDASRYLLLCVSDRLGCFFLRYCSWIFLAELMMSFIIHKSGLHRYLVWREIWLRAAAQMIFFTHTSVYLSVCKNTAHEHIHSQDYNYIPAVLQEFGPIRHLQTQFVCV